MAHGACLSLELNMHLNKQFPAHFVVHIPLWLHVLGRFARCAQSLCKNVPNLHSTV